MTTIYVGYEFDYEGSHNKIIRIDQTSASDRTVIELLNSNMTLVFRAAIRTYFGKASSMYNDVQRTILYIQNTALTCTIDRSLDVPV